MQYNTYKEGYRIGFDAKRLFNNFTGLGNYSRTLVGNLHRQFSDHQYYLYTTSIGENASLQPFLRQEDYSVRLPDIPFKALWRSYYISSQIKKDGLDIYHGLSHELPLAIPKRVKTVVTIHDLIFKRYPSTYPWSDRQMYDYKFRRSCHTSDIIIAISESTKRDIVHFYGIAPEKIKVVYQTCSPHYFEEAHPHWVKEVLAIHRLPTTYMLSVGTVEPRKNLKSIVAAMALLPPKQRIPLVIVGKGAGAYRKEVDALIHQKGLSPFIIWLDHIVQNSHLQAIYSGAQMLIYPSYYEGFGLPIAEATLCRTPVIAADTSSLREAGGKDCLYVHPDSPEEMADSILRVLDDSVLRMRMIEGSYAYAHRQFDKGYVTDQLFYIYKSLI